MDDHGLHAALRRRIELAATLAYGLTALLSVVVVPALVLGVRQGAPTLLAATLGAVVVGLGCAVVLVRWHVRQHGHDLAHAALRTASTATVIAVWADPATLPVVWCACAAVLDERSDLPQTWRDRRAGHRFLAAALWRVRGLQVLGGGGGLVLSGGAVWLLVHALGAAVHTPGGYGLVVGVAVPVIGSALVAGIELASGPGMVLAVHLLTDRLDHLAPAERAHLVVALVQEQPTLRRRSAALIDDALAVLRFEQALRNRPAAATTEPVTGPTIRL